MPLLPNGMVKLAGADENPLVIGSKAIGFTRKNQEGQDVSLEDLAGQPVVLFFTGSFDNSITDRKFRRFAAFVPEIRRAGAVPVVVTTNYWKVNNDYLSNFPDVDFPVLDDEAYALEAVSTYAQPIEGGVDYPVYVLNANHGLTYFKSGPDLFTDEDKAEILAEIGRVARPGAIPPQTPTPQAPAA
jgi:peroxiredoxin